MRWKLRWSAFLATGAVALLLMHYASERDRGADPDAAPAGGAAAAEGGPTAYELLEFEQVNLLS